MKGLIMSGLHSGDDSEAGERIAQAVRQFVDETIIPFEQDPRLTPHGPSDELVHDVRAMARAAGLMSPHIGADNMPLSHLSIAKILRAAGRSPLATVALNVMAPDEGNMNLLARVATREQQSRYLEPLIDGRIRSAFLMTEPAVDGGAGSDPSMLSTQAVSEGDGWVINGRKAFITGLAGAGVGILMARTDVGATMFLLPLPNPAVQIERILNTIDNSMPGGHAIVAIKDLRVRPEDVLGEVGKGFQYAQVRLAPARLTHCMRWLGACERAHDIAVRYALQRQAFGKPLIEHEGVGFQLADNAIDLQQCALMIDWCANVLDTGETGTFESSMAKVAVSEALYRIADRCVQVMGGTGVTDDTIVQQIFREVRAFRIYDGPSEVHRWSIAKRIARHARLAA
jgi:acyl-CoA dehydrogenase